MQIVRKGDGKIVELTDGKTIVRVDQGPVRKTATATSELLDDKVTDARYHAPRKIKAAALPKQFHRREGIVYRCRKTRVEKVFKPEDEVTIYALGSNGKPIELGKPMEYLDRLSPTVEFCVYREESETRTITDPVSKQPKTVTRSRFKKRAGPFATEEEAIAAALELFAPKAPAAA